MRHLCDFQTVCTCETLFFSFLQKFYERLSQIVTYFKITQLLLLLLSNFLIKLSVSCISVVDPNFFCSKAFSQSVREIFASQCDKK